MNRASDHHEETASAPGALAICWAMLRRLLILLATPGADRSIHGLLAELEREVCSVIFGQALALDPSLAGIDPSSLRLVWRDGRLDIDYAGPAAGRFDRAAILAHLKPMLARLRALRRVPVLHALRGANRFNRRAQIVVSCERRRHARRRRPSTHHRVQAPARAHPLALIPP